LEDDVDLKKNVKRVMKTIVGLLKDRITVEKAPDAKRASS
ncbi:5505_t:CDS:1, partial [Gigaspora rosea]